MPLTLSESKRLAETINQQWDLPGLVQFADTLGINLNNEAPSGSFLVRAGRLIEIMNNWKPPRDRELLRLLLEDGAPGLRDVVTELRKVPYFSPTDDPHDAILFGKSAFVDRNPLRQVIHEFTDESSGSTSRVLIVSGDKPSGKSYTWEYLNLLAPLMGNEARHLILKNTGYSPRAIFEQIGLLLGFDNEAFATLPAMADDPQLAVTGPLTNWLLGRISKMESNYWIVIDDLNDVSVTPAMRDAAYALALSAEVAKTNLWVALLGYNGIVDLELDGCIHDQAGFPDASLVALHFETMAKESQNPLTSDKAKVIADFLFAQIPPIDKAGMVKLARLIGATSINLRQGTQPEIQP